MPYCARLIGDFFAAGLHDNFTHNGRSHVSPQTMARFMYISYTVPTFVIAGTRGASVLNDYTIPILINVRPSYVIVDIEGNDLVRGKFPLSVAAAVVNAAHTT